MNPLGKWKLLGCALLLLASCTKTPPEPETPPAIVVPTQSQAVFSNGISFVSGEADPGSSAQPQAQSGTVAFTAPSPWSASVRETKADSWLTVVPSSGGAGDVTMTVTAQPNDTYEDREAEVTITSGASTATFRVKQAGKPRPVAVNSITLDKTSGSVYTGKTLQLTATVGPDNAADKSVTWSSSNPAVATVSETGLVTGVAAGSAVIEAKASSGLTAKCEITVSVETIAVTGITLDKTSESVTVGKTLQLTATVEPADATDKSVSWFSSDVNVATVSETGLVTGVAPGSVVIEAKTASGLIAKCEISVAEEYIPVSGITLNKTELEVNVGETFKLEATVAPANSSEKVVSWRSSSSSTASVDSEGTVTGKKAGTATITASCGNVSVTCQVTVVQKVTAIELNRTSATLTVGNTLYLYATVTPSTAPSASALVWASSDASVATVDASGVVKALAAGTAEITASADGITAKCVITVENVAAGNEGTTEENWK